MSPACWLYRRRLDAYHDGELTPRVRERVATHVAACEACRRELASLGQVRAALAREPVDLPEGAWEAFWPQVRRRLAVAEPAPDFWWSRRWGGVGARPPLALAPALAAAALAILAVLAPWQRAPQAPPVAVPPAGPGPVAARDPALLDHVVIQSIETADPETPVMVYASPDSDVTVLWVFGLERTGA